jgi:hypothetical protein
VPGGFGVSSIVAPAGLIAQVKLAVPDGPVESVAVTVTPAVDAVLGVPVISPLVELIDRFEGRPVAL